MKNLHLEAVFHEPKGRFAYAYNEELLHIRLMTKKDSISNIEIVYGDPFLWTKENDKYKWVSNNKVMSKVAQTDLHDYWQVEISTLRKRFKYAFILEGNTLFGSNKIVEVTNEFNLFNFFSFPFISKSDILTAPSWIDDTVWYHIFPDRFNTLNPLVDWEESEVKNNIIFGGSLKGIESKLDYLVDLGITGLYLNPIFESPSAHKYDTRDYLKVDKSFGTNQDLKDLVKESHNRGIKVMLDAVFNHCGWEHPFFQDVVKNGASSKYYDWFILVDEPMINFEIENDQPVKTKTMPNYHTFAHTKFMPKWNTDNIDTQDYLIGIAVEWIKEFDIDAIRYDVADEVSHDLWTRLNHEVRKVKPDFYHLGETWHNGNPWLENNQFNGIMNYKLMFAIDEYFKEETTISEFKQSINKVLMLYPQNALEKMYNLLDSHDTERALSKYGINTTLAIVFMMLFPGRPAIYYGTEIDLDGANDPDNRKPYPWHKESSTTFDLIKKLSLIKKEHKLKHFKWVQSDSVIYTVDSLIILMDINNKGIIIPKELEGTYTDLLTNKKITLKGNLHLKTQFLILKKG